MERSIFRPASGGWITMLFLFSTFMTLHLAWGTMCNRKNSFGLLEVFSCPKLFGDDDDKYCCNDGKSNARCCDMKEYFMGKGGMDCKRSLAFGATETFPCPKRTLFSDDDDKYCCSNGERDARCCDGKEYFFENGIGVLAGIVVSVIVGVLIILCVCCLCCPFCILYKRRHRGTTYATQLQPGVQTTVAQPTYPPQPTTNPPYPQQQQQQTPYPMQPMGGMPQPYPPAGGYPPPASGYPPPAGGYPVYPPPATAAANPPPYSDTVTTEMYPKQAPYNPNY